MNPLQILQTQFGYSSFRLEQEAIISAVLQQKDTFVLMPTGGGKSLCYQIPALILDGVTIVISPLIALMKDQVDALRLNGISAAFLNSTQSASEQDEVLEKVQSKALKLLYLAPESTFLKKISSFPVSLIAIDEAHCISHWGHDFRPEYLSLAHVKRAMPHIPVIALTATADHLTRKDVVEKLELQNPVTFVSSFNRPNIRYAVEPKKRSFEKLLEFLHKRKDDSGIIYCLSRKSTETLANDLIKEGFQALAYHAGMERGQRSRHQEMFLRDEAKIMVATIAFGMGIDKSNVRYVVHMDLPKNIESYYQETGRAGRDGLDSEALLFYSYADVNKLKAFAQIEGNPGQTEISLRKLDQMARYGDLSTCRRKYLLNYFDEASDSYCGNCDVCHTRAEMVDGTILVQKILSAIVRLQQRFGAGYIIDFLRGANTSKIWGDHKQLKTFGIGADLNKEEWNAIIQDLLSQGYLTKSDGLRPVLILTPKSEEVLKGNERVFVTKSKEKIELAEEEIAYQTTLLLELKEIRRQIALSENVPAYNVLSDATLLEVATYLPHNKEELMKISGFGEVKIERYGRQFWDVVANYCTDHQLKSRIHLKAPKRTRNERPPERDNETKQQTFDLFKKGFPIGSIASMRGLSRSTIEGHLAFYVQQGTLSIDQLMDPAKVRAIQKAIERIGGNSIAPIKGALGEIYSFGEIKAVMAHREYLKQESLTSQPAS